MDRRAFIAATLAAAALPLPGQAGEAVRYVPGVVPAKLAEGKTLLLGFHEVWCTTCDRQKRVIGSLRSSDPVYNRVLTFINIDYGRHRQGELVQNLRIPRRSTLVALHGDQEVGRLIAATGTRHIQDLMDKAVAAAQSA